MGLKFVPSSDIENDDTGINQTIMGLKYFTLMMKALLKDGINQTIMGLKLILLLQTLG